MPNPNPNHFDRLGNRPQRPAAPTAPVVDLLAPLPGLLTPSIAAKRYDFKYSQSFSINAPVGGVNQKQTITIKTQSDSWFIVQTMALLSSGELTARMSDDGSGTIWQSEAVYSGSCYGTAQRPNILIQPLVIPPTSQISIDLTDASAAANSGEIVLGGYRINKEDMKEFEEAIRRGRLDQWFQYAATYTIAASNTAQFAISLDQSSWFEVHKLMARSTPGIASSVSFTARLSDSATGRTWSDRLINQVNMFGTAQQPYVLPFPKLLRPGTVITVEVTDLSGSSNLLQVTLEGAKRYGLGE